ncbi:uncharacterized protein LOC126901743 [Daktulosphaira vitifoliae]|uniref:uncharacterized protein LOC126901743 n=1 Tax=Daktulosphaira vitifoliae TaxID=58002 RepID=UPI0021AAD85C|nr:uncharacterized protein LOC126901743 [Daktulosphaira vitifoliae]
MTSLRSIMLTTIVLFLCVLSVYSSPLSLEKTLSSKQECMTVCLPKCEQKGYNPRCQEKTLHHWSCECYGDFKMINSNIDKMKLLNSDAFVITNNVSDYVSNTNPSIKMQEVRSSLNNLVTMNQRFTQFAKDDQCKNVDFDYGINAVASIKAKGEFCYYASDNWHFDFDGALTLIGISVWNQDVHLHPGTNSISFSPNVQVAKADFEIGLYDDSLCLKVKGSGCVRNWSFNWNCNDFDKTLQCFK